MIGCLRLATPDEAALRALRLRLDRLSPRVQLDQGARETLLLADLGATPGATPPPSVISWAARIRH